MSYLDSLRQRVKDKQEELDREKELKRQRKKDTREVEAYRKLPDSAEQDFFCVPCNSDFKAPGYKHWLEMFDIGVWRSWCPMCNSPVVRYITDKKHDPYYEQSNKIQIMRNAFATDTLRPEDYGFKMLYGDAYNSHWLRFESEREKIRSRYTALGLKGETFDEKREVEKLKEEFNMG